MRGSSVGHPKGPIGGLNSGHLGESPPSEFLGVFHSMVGDKSLWVYELVN